MTREAPQNITPNEKRPIAGLTARQQQILELMQKGKVNKEIARDLDISLGTVKQHLVAIFKKLNVQNRTMAVARLAEFKDQSGFNEAFSRETLIAKRPAIVLSLKTNGRLPRAALKLFHSRLAEAAFDSQALFMSREPGDGDLIFGLKRSSAQDIRTALLVADHLYRLMRDFVRDELSDARADQVLTGALVAGLVTVSQNRFGGWSGETIGSHVLTWGHSLRESTSEGCLYFDEPVKAVMTAFDITLPEGIPDQLPLTDVGRLNDWDHEESFPLIGREQELSEISDLIAGEYPLLIVEGENGMGKSRLCRESARMALAQGLCVHYIRIVSSGFFDSAQLHFAEDWSEMVCNAENGEECLIILDDAHHLTAEGKADITRYMSQLPAGTRALISGRQPQKYAFEDELFNQCRKIHLQKMDRGEITELISDDQLQRVSSEEGRDDIAELSRGIPLFAKELMLQDGDEISLALLITVASRIDKFKVDWKLLYCIASHDSAVSTERLVSLMQDDPAYIRAAAERAETLGLLSYESDQAAFRHPLVRDVVRYLFQPTTNVNSVSEYL